MALQLLTAMNCITKTTTAEKWKTAANIIGVSLHHSSKTFTINAAFAKSSALWVSLLTPCTDTLPPCSIWQDVLEHPGCYFLLSNSFCFLNNASISFSPYIDLCDCFIHLLPICTEYWFHITIVTSSQQTPYWPQGPCVSLLYLLHLMDSMVTVHCSITQAVTWRQSQVLLFLFSLHIKLAQKPRGISALRSHLIHKLNATANSTICMSLYSNMGGVTFSSTPAWCSCRCIFLLGNNIIPIALLYHLQCFFSTIFLLISYITSVYLIKLVISFASIWHQCSLRYHLLLKSDLIRKRQIKPLFAD